MAPLDTSSQSAPMSDSPHSSPLDRAFQAWLRISPTEENLSLNDFLATQPESLRKNLRRMIADYGILQEAVGEQGTTFIEGRTIDDFRLVRELGRGGMGSVWEADQLSLNRRVALKLLKPQFNFSPQSLQRFQREAEAGGRLQHVGIVQTYGVGEADGIHWIAQELIPGGFTFADLLSSLREEPELPVGYYRHVVHVFLQMADALEYAHQQGVIHRDIKPGNILMRSDDLPKVADFGLAQVEDNLGLSRSGDYLGTPYYMSPEQAMSKRMGLDHRSDIFSLGATLYEAPHSYTRFRRRFFASGLPQDPHSRSAGSACAAQPRATRLSDYLRQVSREEPRPPLRFDGRPRRRPAAPPAR